MQEAPTTFDWGALLRLIALWMVVVFLALRALDLLFPRLRRGEDDAPPPRLGPPLRRVTGLRPSAGQPALPYGAHRPAEGRAPSVGLGHWDANVRMIVVLLLIWIAAAFAPQVTGYLVAAHRGSFTHPAILDHLGLTPAFEVGLGHGEGTGAAMVLPLLDQVAALAR